jgi:class 3 adenylate cyclase
VTLAAFVAEDLRESLLIMEAFASAVAWLYRGAPRDRETGGLRASGEQTILFADLSKSLVRGASLPPAENAAWKDTGLNLIAQWAKAFGGREFRDRGGDDIWLTFQCADSAVLCAAALQQHARALRSTPVESIAWAFHVALDTGDVTTGAGGNFIGSCIDRSARLAKKLDNPRLLERVLVTPTTAERCSGVLRDRFLVAMDSEVDLAEELAGTPWGAFARFTPLVLDPLSVMTYYQDEINGAATQIAEVTDAGAELRSLEEAGEPEDLEEPSAGSS